MKKSIISFIVAVLLILPACSKSGVTESLFSYSALAWVDNNKNSRILNEVVITDKPKINTTLSVTMGGSFGRQIEIRVLKDFEEIPSNQLFASSDFSMSFEKTMEGKAQTKLLNFEIGQNIGTGDYILIPLQNYSYKNKGEKSLNQTSVTSTHRAFIKFLDDSERIPQKNLIQLATYASSIPSEAFNNHEIIIAPPSTDTVYLDKAIKEFTLSNQGLAINVSIKSFLQSILSDTEKEQMQFLIDKGTCIPMVIIGYYNNTLLPEKYYISVPIDDVVCINPQWKLTANQDVNFLRVFAFCYPRDTFSEDFSMIQKLLYYQHANAGVYFELKK